MLFCKRAKQHQTMSNFKSFFISYISVDVTKEFIKSVFEETGIGKVERVDFFVKRGWTNKNKKSAFVHLKEWYYTEQTDVIYNTLEEGGNNESPSIE